MSRDTPENYAAEVGREPRELPEDHPDRWQWEYRGRPEERDELLERLSDEPLTAPGEQESLFS